MDARPFLDGATPIETMPVPVGRPNGYTPELALKIADAIADGKKLRDIVGHDGIPSKSTIMRWARNEPEFREIYYLALRWRTECHIEDIMAIAEDASQDYATEAAGTESDPGAIAVYQPQAVMRSKLRVDTLKWVMAKLLPKTFGKDGIGLDIETPAPPAGNGDDARVIDATIQRPDTLSGAIASWRESRSRRPEVAVKAAAA